MEQASHFDSKYKLEKLFVAIVNMTYPFPVASLLSSLHQLKEENVELEDSVDRLVQRRDHLLAVRARLLALSSLSAPSPGAAGPTSATTTPERQQSNGPSPYRERGATSSATVSPISIRRTTGGGAADRSGGSEIISPQQPSPRGGGGHHHHHHHPLPPPGAHGGPLPPPQSLPPPPSASVVSPRDARHHQPQLPSPRGAADHHRGISPRHPMENGLEYHHGGGGGGHPPPSSQPPHPPPPSSHGHGPPHPSLPSHVHPAVSSAAATHHAAMVMQQQQMAAAAAAAAARGGMPPHPAGPPTHSREAVSRETKRH